MRVWCGIDSAEHHHDISLAGADGTELARRRVSDDVAGFTELATLLAGYSAASDEPVPVAIETSKGLLCAVPRAAGYRLYPINPAASRYRDRYAVSRAESDPGDAYVLANILRTDPGAHRPLPDDSELAQEIRVLARAHQDLIWGRQQAASKLRSLLREYYPAFLATFADLAGREARAASSERPRQYFQSNRPPHRIRRLPVGQVLAELQHRHHRQLRRARSPAYRAHRARATVGHRSQGGGAAMGHRGHPRGPDGPIEGIAQGPRWATEAM